MKIALYSGSFDIFTNGHKYVADEALKIFDKLYIAIGINPTKKSIFTLEQKKEMIENVYKNDSRIEIISFEKEFLVNVCRQLGVTHIVRGVRDVKDFEYEKQLYHINRNINPNVQTIYLVPPNDLAGLSSSMVKNLVGISEWQFVVQDMIPRINMSYLNVLAYPSDKVLTFVAKSIYYLTGNDCALGDVVTEYNGAGRYYHTMQHISEMFELSHRCIKANENTLLLYIAIFFHDVIYNPLSTTNEEDSVKDFESYEFKIPENQSKIIKDLIMVTKHHRTDGSHLQNLMVDLDLAVLGSDITRFNEYERQIRNEYSSYLDDEYNAGRIEFLKKILSRPTIFLTEGFQQEYETIARENMNKLVLSLEKK